MTGLVAHARPPSLASGGEHPQKSVLNRRSFGPRSCGPPAVRRIPRRNAIFGMRSPRALLSGPTAPCSGAELLEPGGCPSSRALCAGRSEPERRSTKPEVPEDEQHDDDETDKPDDSVHDYIPRTALRDETRARLAHRSHSRWTPVYVAAGNASVRWRTGAMRRRCGGCPAGSARLDQG